jgi:hypothetical protein
VAVRVAPPLRLQVTLFEKSNEIGGQFNMAKQIPGKEEFHETIRYFKRRLETAKVSTCCCCYCCCCCWSLAECVVLLQIADR